MRVKTYNQGAADERGCWMRHLRWLKGCVSIDTPSASDMRLTNLINNLIEWGKTRTKRAASKPGGLGRK